MNRAMLSAVLMASAAVGCSGGDSQNTGTGGVMPGSVTEEPPSDQRSAWNVDAPVANPAAPLEAAEPPAENPASPPRSPELDPSTDTSGSSPSCQALCADLAPLCREACDNLCRVLGGTAALPCATPIAAALACVGGAGFYCDGDDVAVNGDGCQSEARALGDCLERLSSPDPSSNTSGPPDDPGVRQGPQFPDGGPRL